MKVRLGTIPGNKFPRLHAELQRQNRIDAILWWVGTIGLIAALALIISLFIGLGNMAAVVAQIGGTL